jgi:hypothetical protein
MHQIKITNRDAIICDKERHNWRSNDDEDDNDDDTNNNNL